MAKVTSTIEGYEKMSAEEKLAALENLDVPAPDYTGYVKKETLDKATHEAAEWKRKHNELLTEDERKKVEREEQWNQMQTLVNQLQGEKATAGYKAKFVAQGYSEELAESTAKALFDGDMDTVFNNQAQFLSDLKQHTKAQEMKNTPRPGVGAPNGKEGIDYGKLIEEANERGDRATVAYLMRRQAEDAAQSRKE